MTKIPAFKDFFAEKWGRPWPQIGEEQPHPQTFEYMICEAMADFIDRYVGDRTNEPDATVSE